MKASKGSDFERELCKLLSKWWSWGVCDTVRDDIFWRSSQSGGRATQRLKSGRTTFGSYGDIAAVDPIGQPLLKMFTIELKRGSSYGSPADLFDTKDTPAIRPFEACLLQAARSAEAAGSKGWLLICRRDHRRPVVYADLLTLSYLENRKLLLEAPSIRFNLRINTGKEKWNLRFLGCTLDRFLEVITPAEIMACL